MKKEFVRHLWTEILLRKIITGIIEAFIKQNLILLTEVKQVTSTSHLTIILECYVEEHLKMKYEESASFLHTHCYPI